MVVAHRVAESSNSSSRPARSRAEILDDLLASPSGDIAAHLLRQIDEIFRRPAPHVPALQELFRTEFPPGTQTHRQAQRSASLYVAVRFLQRRQYALVCDYALDVIFDSEANDGYNAAAVKLVQHVERHHFTPERGYSIAPLYSSGIAIPRDYRRAFALNQAAAVKRFLRAGDRVARAYLNGTGIRQNYGAALRLFRPAMEAGQQWGELGVIQCMVEGRSPPPAGLSFIDAYFRRAESRSFDRIGLIIRLCTGVGCSPDMSRAQCFLSTHPDTRAQWWLDVLTERSFVKFCRSDPLATSLRHAYETGSPPVYRSPSLNRRARSASLAVLASALRRLTVRELRQNEAEWATVEAQYACDRFGISFAPVMESALNVGPVMSPLSPRGIPCAKWPAHPLTPRMPQNDFVEVQLHGNAISAIDLNMDEHEAAYGQPLLVAEDAFVAVALAFSGKAPHAPGFSLDPFRKDEMEHLLFQFLVKRFTPSWLAATQFGKSLYLADLLMPPFGLSALISLRTYFDNAESERDHHLAGFYIDIDRARGRFNRRRICSATMEMRRIETVRNRYTKARGDVRERHAITGIDMSFSTRETDFVNGKAVSSPAGPETRNAERARIASARYEEIARALPLFARVRFLLGLAHVFGALRSNLGYSLAPPFERHIAAMVAEWSKRGAGPEVVPRPCDAEPREGYLRI